ncbi:MAG TPA: ComEA family DNA-binding protein [Candidatus Limnocylindrales bacterium]|jgi:competence protein ComEA|nr:ComEA family DNA-binding protein [Candidatus Limnocylindrales bacterium]
MDRTSAPWRVLDDTAVGGVGDETSHDSEAQARPLARLSWRAIAGLALAGALAVAAFAVAATGPGGSLVVDGGTALRATGSREAAGAAASEGVLLVIDVQGAVLRPGVIRLVAGSRVGDAIEAAGGFGPRVDADRAGRELNLAAALNDGDRIVVPSRDDPPASNGGSNGPVGSGGSGGSLVDLNTATASELDALPGIGPVTAKKILDARAEKPFASIDDLRDRKLVGASVFDKIHDLVTVR